MSSGEALVADLEEDLAKLSEALAEPLELDAASSEEKTHANGLDDPLISPRQAEHQSLPEDNSEAADTVETKAAIHSLADTSADAERRENQDCGDDFEMLDILDGDLERLGGDVIKSMNAPKAAYSVCRRESETLTHLTTSPKPLGSAVHTSPAPFVDAVHTSSVLLDNAVHTSSAYTGISVHTGPAPSGGATEMKTSPSGDSIHTSLAPSHSEMHPGPAHLADEVHTSATLLGELVNVNPAPLCDQAHTNSAPSGGDFHTSSTFLGDAVHASSKLSDAVPTSPENNTDIITEERSEGDETTRHLHGSSLAPGSGQGTAADWDIDPQTTALSFGGEVTWASNSCSTVTPSHSSVVAEPSTELNAELSTLSAFLAAPRFWPEGDDDMNSDAEAAGVATSLGAADDGSDAELEGDIDKLSQVLAAPEALDTSPPTVTAALSKPASSSQMGSRLLSRNPSEKSLYMSSIHEEAHIDEDFSDDEDFMSSEMPANLENCLALNTAYQEVVDENLDELERLLLHNREQQCQLQTMMSVLSSGEVSNLCPPSAAPVYTWSPFTHNYFRDSTGFGPVSNPDATRKESRREFEDQRTSIPWLQSERELLMMAALKDERQRHTAAPRHRLRMLEEKVSLLKNATESTGSTGDADASCDAQSHLVDSGAQSELWDQLEQAEKALRQAEEKSLLEALSDRDPDHLDWVHISDIEFCSLRSAFECRQQWVHFVRPCISHAAWTSEEDEAIREGATEVITGCNRWENLALRLDSGRTAFQVFQRWVTALMPVETTYWSEAETMRLVNVVAAAREHGRISWPRIAAHLPGRSAQQCYGRYDILAPDQRRGSFTIAEDMRILAAREELGITDWKAIADFLPGRHRRQVNARYSFCLAPHLGGACWTRENDLKLVRYVYEHGTNWVGAAKALGPSFNNNACIRRFRKICLAFRKRGELPAEGQLATEDRFTEGYYNKVRRTFNCHMEHLMPKDDKPDARKRAAIAFLKKAQIVPKKPKVVWKTAPPAKLERQKQQKLQSWDDLSEVLMRQLHRPYQKGIKKDISCTSNAHVDAAKLTALAWCVPPPDANQLEKFTDEASVSFSEASLLEAWADAEGQSSPTTNPEFPWNQMPLLPPTYSTVGTFRSLLLWRHRLEMLMTPDHENIFRRRRKIKNFKTFVTNWAERAMTPSSHAGGSTTPWLRPTELTRNRDRLAQVKVTQKQKDKPSRVLTLTVAAEETNDVPKLATRLCKQIPGLVKLAISKAPEPDPERSERRDAVPSDPAAAAWHRLTSRFVSMFFMPALMSTQQPRRPRDGDSDSEPEQQPTDIFGQILVPDGQLSSRVPRAPAHSVQFRDRARVKGCRPKLGNKRNRRGPQMPRIESLNVSADEPVPVKRARVCSRR